MNRSTLISALLAMLCLAACDRPVVNAPAAPEPAPGPLVPQGTNGSLGAQGMMGNERMMGNEAMMGSQGATGNPRETTTGIVMPPANSPPAN